MRYMRVAYITGMYPTRKYPQKGIFCHEQVKALLKLGIDVDVIVPMAFYDREYEGPFWEYEGVNIQYIRFFKLPGSRGYEKTGERLFKALKRAIDFEIYDVIHADAPLPAGDAAYHISKEYGIPFIIHGHGLDVFSEESYGDKKNGGIISEKSTALYKVADAVCCVSGKVKRNIEKKVDLADRGYVVYNGVDETLFLQKEHNNEHVEILSAGDLIEIKGHEYTIRALKMLDDEYPDKYRLTILGRGELEEKLKKLVSELHMEHIVSFKGYVPYDEVREYMRDSDIFVLPSFNEALGCVYLEAMASGLPVIGCLDNGIDEIVNDGVDGYLVKGRDERGIYDSILKMTVDGDLRQMGVTARKKVAESFTWTDSAKSMIKVYERVINGV